MTEDIAARVRSMVAQVMDIPESAIAPKTSIRQDLGADDLDALQIIFELEDAWPPIEFSDAEIAELRTVGDLVSHLATKLGLVEAAA